MTARSGIDYRQFEDCIGGKRTSLYILENRNGMEVCLCNFGARVVSIVVPDRTGNPKEVTLGFDNLDDYRFVNCNFGATIGRYANRIACARFQIDDKEHILSANNGQHCLHGGTSGWQTKVFTTESQTDSTILFTYLSPHGEEGFPGNVSVSVEYTLTTQNELRIFYTATTDRPTVVNLTNHTFFNLSGDPSESALDHLLYVNADHITPIDSTLIPTGEVIAVAGTPMDFRTSKRIAAQMDTAFSQLEFCRGYDHNWILNTHSLDSLATSLYCPRTGIMLEVYTDEPGIQVFTANTFDGAFEGRNAIAYRNHPAVCLETQHFPNSPNMSQWPTTTLRPGEIRHSNCIYRFRIR